MLFKLRIIPFSRFLPFLTLAMLFLMIGISSAQAVTISAAFSNNGIPTLVDANGFTLYTFSRDEAGVSNCDAQCAENWPPFLLKVGDMLSVGDGVVGQISTIQREDGSTQVTYNGWPLYYFSQDAAAGDTFGHGIRDLWFAANPAMVMLSQNGRYLIGAGGLTLYVFTEDAYDESYCLEECSTEWPPVIVPEGEDLSFDTDITGVLGVAERPDGRRQATYNGWPLYFYHEDENPGDVNGDGVKDVWFIADVGREDAPREENPRSAATSAPVSPSSTPIGATAEATGESTPEATGEATSEVTPELTPEATGEATSEVTPEITPEATSSP